MKKLAIVGSGSNTRDKAPFDDPDYDIWVFNEAANSTWCERWTAVFQMHKPEIYKGHNTKDKNHWQWLQRKHFKPVYMQEIDPLVPDSVRFPLEDAIALTGQTYFASSFAYMAALAKMQGYEQIDIHGVELSASEYQYQAECWRYWIGYLYGAGIAVNLHSGQGLFKAPLYGYEGNFSFGADFFAERASLLDAQWNAAEKNARNVKKTIDKVIERNEYGKLADLIRNYQVAVQNVGECAGALAEAERYQAFGDRYADRGGFEYAAASAQRDGEEKRILTYSKIGLIEYLAEAWAGSEGQTEFQTRARAYLIRTVNEYGRLSEETGALLGKYRENIAYILQYDEMVQAHGGLKSDNH